MTNQEINEPKGRARLDALREQLLRATLEDLLATTPHLDCPTCVKQQRAPIGGP